MLKHTFARHILAATAATLIAGAAYADDATKSGDSKPMTTSPGSPSTPSTQPGNRSQSMQPGGTSTMPQATQPAQSAQPTFQAVQGASELRVEQMIGTKVVNAQSEEVGAIDDLIVDPDRGVVAAVISVGGFLGLGEKLVAVNADSVDFQQTQENTLVAMVDVSKADLETAPAFEKADASVVDSMKSTLSGN